MLCSPCFSLVFFCWIFFVVVVRGLYNNNNTLVVRGVRGAQPLAFLSFFLLDFFVVVVRGYNFLY